MKYVGETICDIMSNNAKEWLNQELRLEVN